jgi:ligand-binding sensor protein
MTVENKYIDANFTRFCELIKTMTRVLKHVNVSHKACEEVNQTMSYI